MTDVMTSKKRRKKKVPYPFAVELIEQLQGQVEHKDGESILGETGLAGQLKKMLAKRMLSAEMSHHLLYGTQVSRTLMPRARHADDVIVKARHASLMFGYQLGFKAR